MSEAACAFSPAVATMTTRSALLTSSIRSLVRPARSLSQPCMEKRSASSRPRRANGSDAVKKLALSQRDCARSLTTRSLAADRAR